MVFPGVAAVYDHVVQICHKDFLGHKALKCSRSNFKPNGIMLKWQVAR